MKYFIEAWTVVEGAQDKDWTGDSLVEAQRWLDSEIAECQQAGLSAQGYRIIHPHAEGIECECHQYVTSHLPYAETYGEPV